MHTEHDTRVCDYCASSFWCTRLDAALNVLDAHPERLAADPHLARLHRQIKEHLAAAGWDYPNSGRRCALSGATLAVRRLTDELITAMKPTTGPKSLHGEETHRD